MSRWVPVRACTSRASVGSDVAASREKRVGEYAAEAVDDGWMDGWMDAKLSALRCCARGCDAIAVAIALLRASGA